MAVAHHSEIATQAKAVLKYLGFPSSFEAQIIEKEYRGLVKRDFIAHFSFDFSISPRSEDEPLNELKEISKAIFEEFLKSDPIKHQIEKQDKVIAHQKEYIQQLQKEAKEMQKYKDHYELAKGLK